MKANNTPSYYGGEDNPYEARKVIEVLNLGFNLSNALKYVSRLGKKDKETSELNKVRNYLIFEIERLNKGIRLRGREQFLWPNTKIKLEAILQGWKIEDGKVGLLVHHFLTLNDDSNMFSYDHEYLIAKLKEMILIVDSLLGDQIDKAFKEKHNGSV